MTRRNYITPVAESVPFDNDTNGFVADNVQEAIEEVAANSGSIFGSEFTDNSSEGVSSASATFFNAKVGLAVQDLTDGAKYRIGWYAEAKNTLANNVVEVEIVVNDIQVSLISAEMNNTSDWWNISGHFYYTVSRDEFVYIDMNYRPPSGGTAQIRRARLEFWRVS